MADGESSNVPATFDDTLMVLWGSQRQRVGWAFVVYEWCWSIVDTLTRAYQIQVKSIQFVLWK